MTTITPDYFKNFECIADKCKHNCCIGWEIEVDENTLNKYSKIDGDFGLRLKNNIDLKDTAHFKLDKNERCPFLNNKGLCDIITNLGKNMLCQICSDHPRFRNFYSEHTEIGIGLCCEAAAKLILTKKDKTKLEPPLDKNFEQADLLKFRDTLFEILQDRNFSIDERVKIMLDRIGEKLSADKNWYSVFYSLEKLDPAWEEYLLRIKNGIGIKAPDNSLDTSYEQLLVYLIFRHFSDAQYDGMLKERILFAVLIYHVIKTMNTSNTVQELIEISRLYSCEIEYSDENIKILLSELKTP